MLFTILYSIFKLLCKDFLTNCLKNYFFFTKRTLTPSDKKMQMREIFF